LIMAALAFLEVFDRRKLRHWAIIGPLGALMVSLGIVWIGIRVAYRERYVQDDKFSSSRSARVDALSGALSAWASQSSADLWQDVDQFVDRMWTIYYPALMLDRVPS